MDIKPKVKAVNTAFSAYPDDLEKLDALCNHYGGSRSELIRSLIVNHHHELKSNRKLRNRKQLKKAARKLTK